MTILTGTGLACNTDCDTDPTRAWRGTPFPRLLMIVAALAKGETAKAEALMAAHIGSVQEALDESSAVSGDPRERLRASLTPLKSRGGVA